GKCGAHKKLCGVLKELMRNLTKSLIPFNLRKSAAHNWPRVAGLCWGKWGRGCESRGKWWGVAGMGEMELWRVAGKKEQEQYI
nr:hypothetical protein [Tanacetum cinerariifolium]